MVKVLYITNSGNWGGASIALKNIWTQLDNLITISVLFPNIGEFSKYAENKGYQCYYYKYGLDVWPKFRSLKEKFLFFPSVIYKCITQYVAYRKICNIVKCLKPDIIHTNVGPLQFVAKAAKKYKIPHVWHLREYQIKDFKMFPFPSLKSFKKQLEGSFKIAITNDIARYFELGADYKIVYDGVVSKNNSTPNISFTDSDYLLFVGRLEDAKGWKESLNAFISIADDYPNIKLLFAGSYIEEDVLYITKTLPINVRNRIFFLGYRSDCHELMRKARALLVSSFSEGFGFITTEAMYNGCIVIGRNSGGTKEQFDNGLKVYKKEIGLRFNSQQELENQIKYVLSKPKSFFKEMIINAQNITLKLYSVEKNANDILNIYKTKYIKCND